MPRNVVEFQSHHCKAAGVDTVVFYVCSEARVASFELIGVVAMECGCVPNALPVAGDPMEYIDFTAGAGTLGLGRRFFWASLQVTCLLSGTSPVAAEAHHRLRSDIPTYVFTLLCLRGSFASRFS